MLPTVVTNRFFFKGQMVHLLALMGRMTVVQFPAD